MWSYRTSLRKMFYHVIPPNDVGVHFEDIGALENVKDTLKKLVMVPLQRPELFCKGQLRKPAVKGILIALWTCWQRYIVGRWFMEGEKYVKAVFSLIARLLGSRENPSGLRARQRIKNEFMVHWDGLHTKDQECVLVLGATERPYDLKEAVIYRAAQATRECQGMATRSCSSTPGETVAAGAVQAKSTA